MNKIYKIQRTESDAGYDPYSHIIKAFCSNSDAQEWVKRMEQNDKDLLSLHKLAEVFWADYEGNNPEPEGPLDFMAQRDEYNEQWSKWNEARMKATREYLSTIPHATESQIEYISTSWPHYEGALGDTSYSILEVEIEGDCGDCIMDNRLFSVNGKGKDMLSLTLQLAFLQSGYKGCEGWSEHPKKGLILYWHVDNGNQFAPSRFLVPLSGETVANDVYAWLQTRQPEQFELLSGEDNCDHDGHNSVGWRVYCEEWGHVAGDSYAIVAIKPVYLWHGK